MTCLRESCGLGARGRRVLPILLFCILGIAFVLAFYRVQVLALGGTGFLLRASPGDLFSLRYIHSMYGVEVEERFLVGQGDFTLFQVRSSDAALEYFGIEHAGKDNVRRTLRSFNIPNGSIGKHKLLFKDRVLELSSPAGQGESITVTLTRMSLLEYLAHTLRR